MSTNLHPNTEGTAASKSGRAVNIVIVLVTVAVIALVLIVALTLGGDGDASQPQDPVLTYEEFATDAPAPNADMAAVRREIDSMRVEDFTETARQTQYVKITVKGYGEMVIRLRPDIAPLTVKNFQNLVFRGFYDGLTVHRVVKGFVIQGGDPKGDGSGGSADPVMGEFSANGTRNDLSHILGVISMARNADLYNSATSQFMICNADAAANTLDGSHAAFGYVVAGLETVLLISEAEVTAGSGEVSRPVEPIILEKICFVTPKSAATESNG